MRQSEISNQCTESANCPDHGIDGFKRYVALATVARNIHRMEGILWQQDLERKYKSIKRNLKRRLTA